MIGRLLMAAAAEGKVDFLHSATYTDLRIRSTGVVEARIGLPKPARCVQLVIEGCGLLIDPSVVSTQWTTEVPDLTCRASGKHNEFMWITARLNHLFLLNNWEFPIRQLVSWVYTDVINWSMINDTMYIYDADRPLMYLHKRYMTGPILEKRHHSGFLLYENGTVTSIILTEGGGINDRETVIAHLKI